MSRALILKLFWTSNLIGGAFVIWRLYKQDLHAIYRFFFGAMVLALLRSLALYPFATNDHRYYLIWVSTQPLIWLSYILVVFELYSFVLKRYRGIYSLGRWFFFGALAIAVLVSALTVLPTFESTSSAGRSLERSPLLVFYALAERGIETTLAVLLLLLMVFVAVFAIPLSRNLLIHCIVYCVYFVICNVTVLYWSSGSGKMTTYYWGGLVRLAVAAGCYSAWTILLRREGEHRMTCLHLGRNAVYEKRLLGQLEDFNTTLLGAARK